MAALTFCLLSASQQLYRIGCVFFNSGFSVTKCIVYIREIRKERLFRKYLAELNNSDNNTVKNNDNSDYSDSVYKKIMNKNQNQLKGSRMSSVISSIDDDEEIEIIEGYEIDKISSINTAFYDFIDPRLVYSNSNLDKIEEGASFMINGKILPNCERFSINFILNTPNRDIALHINPRLPQNYIVRNCKVKGIWGREEVTSAFPCCLERGKDFSIQVLITSTEFLLSVNGRHFASFRHRLPFNQISCLEIKGDVDNIIVDRNVVSTYPQILENSEPKTIGLLGDNDDNGSSLSIGCYRNSSLPSSEWSSKIICGVKEASIEIPFYGKLKDKFLYGKRLRFEGRVKILPHSFFINLQSGHHIWPHPVIAFHFNPRFANIGGKHIICRNSWFNGKWDQEERTEMKTDFMPGKSFTLCIYCGEMGYEVTLNEQFLTEYKFRLKPEIVDTIYLQGDIKLWDVVLEEGKSSRIIE